MQLTIYKKGQGFWTRVLSAIGGGTLVLAGIAWAYAQVAVVLTDMAEGTQTTIRLSIVIGCGLVFGGLLYYLLNKPRIVDFMIATEAEMRKVNWPSKREIIGSTWVVICGTAMICLLLFGIDNGFAFVFEKVGILDIPTVAVTP